MQGRTNRKKEQGFTALEMIVAIAVVVLLAGLILPRMTRTHCRPQRINCVSNLKQVGLAARMWANDNGGMFSWQVSTSTNGTLELVNGPSVSPHFLSMSNEMNTPRILACPKDVNRVKAMSWSEFDDKHLSYFVGLDADETRPQSILSGDRNITGGVRVTNTVFQFTSNSVVGFTRELHNQQGNLAFGDGSAMQISRSAVGTQINAALLSSGQPALRLAIP
jgi:prepilin-type N-terminal cleavage/methylation domain-containing protein/prepilin-type processing-associated H-X9-DG protein